MLAGTASTMCTKKQFNQGNVVSKIFIPFYGPCLWLALSSPKNDKKRHTYARNNFSKCGIFKLDEKNTKAKHWSDTSSYCSFLVLTLAQKLSKFSCLMEGMYT